MTGTVASVEDAFQRGRMVEQLQDHERQLRALDRHIADSARSLEAIRVTLARILVAVPIVVILSNIVVALVMLQLTGQ